MANTGTHAAKIRNLMVKGDPGWEKLVPDCVADYLQSEGRYLRERLSQLPEVSRERRPLTRPEREARVLA